MAVAEEEVPAAVLALAPAGSEWAACSLVVARPVHGQGKAGVAVLLGLRCGPTA